jgi:hypothetical protein
LINLGALGSVRNGLSGRSLAIPQLDPGEARNTENCRRETLVWPTGPGVSDGIKGTRALSEPICRFGISG